MPARLTHSAGQSVQAPTPLRRGGAGKRTSLVWFSSADLRLDDHEPLARGHADCTSLLPVFFFDSREAGAPGGARWMFLRECVAELRAALRERGSDLVVREGAPEALLPTLAKAVGAAAVYAYESLSARGRAVQERVRVALDGQGCALRQCSFAGLHAPETLPFSETPTTFAAYLRAVRVVPPAEPVPAPTELRRLPLGCPEAGELPELPAGKGNAAPETAALRPRGGEAEARRQLSACTARLSASARPSSAPLSPWLALGCLSPRRAHAELLAAMREAGCAAERELWLSFELVWNDFAAALRSSETASGRQSAVTPALLS